MIDKPKFLQNLGLLLDKTKYSELKKCHPETGIIIISTKNSLDDKVLGLDLGADDYQTKPFHLSELNSRIKSLLSRHISTQLTGRYLMQEKM